MTESTLRITPTMALTKTALFAFAGLVLAILGNATALAARDHSNLEAWRDPHDYYDPDWRHLLKKVDEYHLRQGTDKMLNKQYQYAWEDFDFMLRYFPNHPQALELMGDLSILMNKPEMGDDYYRKAFTLFPKGTRGSHYSGYAKFLIKTGRYKDAVEAGKTALKKTPNSTEAHYYLGLAYYALNDYKLANEHAQKAYARNYPLTDLRDKLIEAKAWKP
jgi:tetratricopeptide (TPR) repeat protein